MQAFKPDCTIYVALHARGKPAKFSFAVWMVDGKSRPLFSAAKFVGMGQRVHAELTALQLGLEQARRLRQEKIELRLGPGISADYFRENRNPPREADLKNLLLQVQTVFNEFRLRRYMQVPLEQMPEANALAEKANKGLRNPGDLL